jgi:hypothetical protein
MKFIMDVVGVMILEEAVVGYLQVLSLHSPEETEEKHGNTSL